MPTWQDLKALDDELQQGAKLARRWLKLRSQMIAMSDDARHEFDRVLKLTIEAADGELDASPLLPIQGNSMGGPEPGVMPDHEEN